MTGNCETMGHCAFNILFTKSVPHIIEKIFLSLDYESFKNCMEVSKTWRSLLSSERFQLMGESMFCEELQRDLWQASQWGHLKEVRKTHIFWSTSILLEESIRKHHYLRYHLWATKKWSISSLIKGQIQIR